MNLSDEQLALIRLEVDKAATEHLHAQDADTAMSHFADDVVAISNLQIFFSRQSLEEDVRAFYDILQEVNEAAWNDAHIVVVNQGTATFTAKFRYAFTNMDDEVTRLEGVWTALFVRLEGNWKIRVRHESFVVR